MQIIENEYEKCNIITTVMCTDLRSQIQLQTVFERFLIFWIILNFGKKMCKSIDNFARLCAAEWILIMMRKLNIGSIIKTAWYHLTIFNTFSINCMVALVAYDKSPKYFIKPIKRICLKLFWNVFVSKIILFQLEHILNYPLIFFQVMEFKTKYHLHLMWFNWQHILW